MEVGGNSRVETGGRGETLNRRGRRGGQDDRHVA